MHGGCVSQEGAIEIERFPGLRSFHAHGPGSVKELPAARPQLQAEIVNGVVSVRVCRNHCAEKRFLRPGKELGNPAKLFPRLRYVQRFSVLSSKTTAFLGIFKK